MSTDALLAWLNDHWIGILLWALAFVLVFRFGKPAIHRLMTRLVRPQIPEGEDPTAYTEEAAKRVNTIERLIEQAIKGAFVLAVAIALLAAFDLFAVVAALGVVVFGVILASKEVVLDLVMGIFILAEGQYYRGDVIQVGGLAGTVEDVTLRRTVIRDLTGTVHSLSNGEIRVSSNMTRVYAGIVIDVAIVDPADIDRAAALIDRVGSEMADDPSWSDKLLDKPQFLRVQEQTEQGITLRAVGKVRAAERFNANGELRRRIMGALSAEGIQVPSQRLFSLGRSTSE